eukprot:gene12982-biopygen1822
MVAWASSAGMFTDLCPESWHHKHIPCECCGSTLGHYKIPQAQVDTLYPRNPVDAPLPQIPDCHQAVSGRVISAGRLPFSRFPMVTRRDLGVRYCSVTHQAAVPNAAPPRQSGGDCSGQPFPTLHCTSTCVPVVHPFPSLRRQPPLGGPRHSVLQQARKLARGVPCVGRQGELFASVCVYESEATGARGSGGAALPSASRLGPPLALMPLGGPGGAARPPPRPSHCSESE